MSGRRERSNEQRFSTSQTGRYGTDWEEELRLEISASKNRFSLSRIADEALKFVGCTYKLGGIGEDNTIDCSGLVYRAIKDSGYNPSVVRQNAITYRNSKESTFVERGHEQKGDLVHFNHSDGTYHIGIVYDPKLKTMLNAVSESADGNGEVKISYYNSSYWAPKLEMFSRPNRMTRY